MFLFSPVCTYCLHPLCERWVLCTVYIHCVNGGNSVVLKGQNEQTLSNACWEEDIDHFQVNYLVQFELSNLYKTDYLGKVHFIWTQCLQLPVSLPIQHSLPFVTRVFFSSQSAFITGTSFCCEVFIFGHALLDF